MDKPIYTDLNGQNLSNLIDFKNNHKNADPGSPATGVLWYNTTDNRYRYSDGTGTRTVATLADIGGIGAFKGAHDASVGSVPVAGVGDDVSAGDFWRVSVAGTISGIQGADTLEANDLIYALVDNASVAGDFVAVQVNQDFSSFSKEDTRNLASLPASTLTDVNPVGLTTIGSYIIMTSTGLDITSSVFVQVDQSSPKISIFSLFALTNLEIKFQGT